VAARGSCQTRAQVIGRASGVVLHAVVRWPDSEGNSWRSLIFYAIILTYNVYYNIVACSFREVIMGVLLSSGILFGMIGSWAIYRILDAKHRRQQQRRIGLSQPLRLSFTALPLYLLLGAFVGMIGPVLFLMLSPDSLLRVFGNPDILKDGWTIIGTGVYGFLGGIFGGACYFFIAIIRKYEQ
jgi:H+/Cl- antiporter ClcA